MFHQLIMGCLCSRGTTPDSPRTFKVINVDDHGQERNPGRIEITHSELVWYQRSKEPIRWPLNSLRRYGFDAELFSFECGRRCPTGPGIYAFKCRQAEALFNLLQESVQRQRTGQEDTILPLSGSHTMPIVQHNHSSSHSSSNGHARSVELPSGDQIDNSPLYINNEVITHEYINTHLAPRETTGVTLVVPASGDDGGDHVIQYAELDLPQMGDNGSITDSTPVHQATSLDELSLNPSSQQAMYVNVPANEIKTKGPSLASIATPIVPKATTPRNGLTRQYGDEPQRPYTNLPKTVPSGLHGPPGPSRMNYAQLDLLTNSDNMANGLNQLSMSASNPESPTCKTDTYAMIDIERTQALNNKKIFPLDDEGSRKTRHNSNIEELQ